MIRFCLALLISVFAINFAVAKTSLRSYSEKTLSNGLKVLFVEDQSLPYISLGLMLKSGATEDPENAHGLSHFVATLLEKGTKKRKASQIADELGQIASSFHAATDDDFIYLTASSLSNHQNELLDIFSDIVVSPSFAADEVERARKQILAHIQQEVDEPSAYTDLLFEQFLFGAHPYGSSILGTAKEVRTIQRGDIIRHYFRYYRPNNAILAVVGHYSPDTLEQLELKFKDWKPRDLKPMNFPAVEPITKTEILLVNKSDLTQSQIRLGHVGISRKNPDFLTLRLANNILGTGFSSRLVDQIRVNLGLTYSISSGFEALMDKGPFEISTFTRNEKVGETISKILEVLEKFVSEGVTQSEIDAAKGYMIGVFPRAIETAEDLASNLLRLRLYGIPDTYLTQFEDVVDGISRVQVNKAIQDYFHPKNLKILVYSNKTQALPQLKLLGADVQVK